MSANGNGAALASSRAAERSPLIGRPESHASSIDGNRYSKYSLHQPGGTVKGYGSILADQSRHASSAEGEPAEDAVEAAEQDPKTPPMRVLVPILIACWVPVFIGSLDSTIVATLLSSISSSFHSSEQSAWLGSAFLVSVACFTPIYGRLCDILGRRNTLLLAQSFFATGTLLCGLSNSMPMLIAARAIAGMGAGGVTTTASVVMSDLVPLKNRGLLQGLTNIVFGLGGGLGGPIGGWLNDSIGWKPAFLIQIPVLAIALVLIAIFIENKPRAQSPTPVVHETRWQQLKNVDSLGSLTLLIGVSAPLIALSLMSANDRPVSDPYVIAGLVLGPIFLAAFVYIEAYIAAKPILPLRLLKQRTGLSHALSNFFLVSPAGCCC